MYCLAIYSILVDSPSWAGQCLPTNWPEKKEVENSYLFCKKKYIFSILSAYFYKTPILIYLSYHLFYLNNNISLIFYYIKQTTIHMAPLIFFLLCCEKKDRWESNLTGREKKNKKNHLHMNNNRAYIHGYCSFAKYFYIFTYFYKYWCEYFLN